MCEKIKPAFYMFILIKLRVLCFHSRTNSTSVVVTSKFTKKKKTPKMLEKKIKRTA